MQCYVNQGELFILPISMSDDKVVVMPIDTGHWEVARRKTLKLKSIEEPRLHKMRVRGEDLDESGKEIERR